MKREVYQLNNVFVLQLCEFLYFSYAPPLERPLCSFYYNFLPRLAVLCEPSSPITASYHVLLDVVLRCYTMQENTKNHKKSPIKKTLERCKFAFPPNFELLHRNWILSLIRRK